MLFRSNFPITQLVIALDNIAKKTEDGEALVSSLVAEKASAEAAEAPAAE